MPATLWQQIHDDLASRIASGQLVPSAVLPTDVELAEQWGVSRLTAHRALYELQRSGFVVRKRKIGTVVAERPPTEKPNIAAIFMNVGHRFESALLSSLSTGFGDEVRLQVAESRHKPEREAELIETLSREVDGIVLFPTCAPENNDLIQRLVDRGYPLVVVDRYLEGVACDAVLTDNYEVTRQGVQWLIERGHRVIAHFTDFEAHVVSTAQRLQAFRDVIAEQMPGAAPLVRTFPYLAPEHSGEYEQAVQLVHDSLHTLLASANPPTALFCLRDLYAAAAVEACERLQVSVPGDLEILAFLDRRSLLVRRPEVLARIHQDLEEVGRIAAQRVLERLSRGCSRAERFLVRA
ncbi:MAG: GntR family transcriptional regulator, partial [Fimbriimonadaceae bacterium]|nr:GntR family transcriptional regulator [Fimbriimonadaceae bacterium]